jgi:hypothetical protein
VPILDPNDPRRRDEARARRQAAADLAFSRTHPTHEANEDEDHLGEKFPMNFTKGLPHDPTTGLLVKGADYRQFVKAIFSGDRRDFRETPLGHAKTKGHSPAHIHCGPKSGEGDESLDLRSEGIARLRTRLVDNGLPADAHQIAEKLDHPNGIGLRAWESQSAGLAFDLEGPDAQAVTMPPAPGLSNSLNELAAEMAEVYAQALLRDVPFEYLDDSVEPPAEHKANIAGILEAINELRAKHGFDDRIIGYHEDGKPITVGHHDGDLTLGTLFRGITPGDLAGPYLSQFLLVGNGGVNGSDSTHSITDGQVTYGAIRADLRVRYAVPCVDYMTTWPEWYSVQCAADVSKLEIYANQVDNANVDYRLMASPRDLSTYVHYDALYEAYLNACLYLLGSGVGFDPGIPFQGPDDLDHQQGFAHFGGPHLLSLVTEVATRALKCVRYQKFNVHRRLRPEALAARMEKAPALGGKIPGDADAKFTEVYEMLEDCGLLELVRDHNQANNDGDERNALLPLAFTEGSPMHPTYGAGHATVAGACVTVLKAFFDGTHELSEVYVPTIDDEATGASSLKAKAVPEPLTVEGELNKLAANISIGRDWAGVHYYSDYVESLRMGEEIAIGILKEQKLMFQEEFHMSFTSFDGTPISI